MAIEQWRRYLAGVAAITPQSTWDGDWQWLKGVAVSVVIFFLAWGLKDVKSRYDKVPELEKVIVKLNSQIEDMQRRIEDLEK